MPMTVRFSQRPDCDGVCGGVVFSRAYLIHSCPIVQLPRMGGKESIKASSRMTDLTLSSPYLHRRSQDVRLALMLTYITLGWMTIEGAASLLLGWASKSLLLEAFGIDSIIELFSATVLLWRLRIEASGRADEQRVEAVEHRASRLVGYTLYFLVAYVVFNSAYDLFVAHRVTDTDESAWGILIGLVAKIGMPILGGYKMKIAARLNSRALRADQSKRLCAAIFQSC